MKQVSAGERWQLILSGDPVEISMLEVLLEGSQAEAVDEFIKDSCRSENLPLGLTGLPDEHCRFTILTYMLGLSMIEVREYVDAAGKSPFTKWLRDLNVRAAVKVAAALERIAAMPQLYALVDERHRLIPIRKSQYLIVYRYEPDADEVIVVAVAHAKRNPPPWRS